MLVRHSRTVTATIANAETTSGVIDVTELAFGSFALPAEFTGSAVTFTSCDTADGTFNPVYKHVEDADGVATQVQISLPVTQGRSYPIPAECFGFNFIKIVSGSAEGAARSIKVTAKG